MSLHLPHRRRHHAASANPGTTNLKNWWEMDEASGDRLDSHDANAITLTGYTGGAPTYTAGGGPDGGDCADYVAGDMLIDDATIPSYAHTDTASSAFTAGVWVKKEGSWTTTSGESVCIMGGYHTDPSSYRDWIVYHYTSTDELRFQRYLASGTQELAMSSSSSTLPVDEWCLYIFRHDLTGSDHTITARVYDQTSVLYSDSSTSSSSGATNNHLARISMSGLYHSTAYTDYDLADGKTAKGFIFDRELTDAECDWLWNSGSGRTYADL